MDTWTTANCLHVLPQLGDDAYDVCIADPPYDDHELINAVIPEIRRVAKTSFIFMYAEDLSRLETPPDQVLFWIKPVSTKNTTKRYSRFVEVIAVYGLNRSPFRQDTHWSTRTGVFTDSLVGLAHPFAKPESLIEKLLAVNAGPSSDVLDPFAGSGTVARVCERLGHNCDSIEIMPGLEPWR